MAAVSGLYGAVGQTNYAAANGAVLALTRPLGEVKKHMIQAVPMQRAITAGEVAAAIAFLLSDDASAITGQVLRVEGGSSA